VPEAKLNELILALKSQGVESGQEEGRRIVAQAQSEAARLVEEAKAQTQALRDQARAEVERQEQQLRSSLEIAAVQFVARLKKDLEHDLLTVPLRDQIRSELGDAEFLKALLQKCVETFASGDKRHDLAVLLPEKMQAQLKQYVVDLMGRYYGEAGKQDELRLELGGSDVKYGFALDLQDGHSRLEFTDQAFMELFLGYLSPWFRSLFRPLETGPADK
jgi:V/A-type H+/Na+-transporting ATPase subunit E